MNLNHFCSSKEVPEDTHFKECLISHVQTINLFFFMPLNSTIIHNVQFIFKLGALVETLFFLNVLTFLFQSIIKALTEIIMKSQTT